GGARDASCDRYRGTSDGTIVEGGARTARGIAARSCAMTARWMHPPEIERADKADDFDPVRAGERYRLPRELSLAIWKRVCDGATDSSGGGGAPAMPHPV